MTRRTTQEEHESRVKQFVALPHQSGPWGRVTCPHCEGEFEVDGKRWRAPLQSTIKPELEIRTRPCPYCFKASLVPNEFYPKSRRKDRAPQPAATR